MNNIREKLAEAAAEEDKDDDQTTENIYNIELMMSYDQRNELL